MERRRLTAVLAAVACVAFAACTAALLLLPDEESKSTLPLFDESEHQYETPTVYFEGEILEIGETQVLIAPDPNTNNVMAFDRVLVNTTLINGEQVHGLTPGQRVGILFDGKVAMSLPAQVLAVYGYFQPK